VSLTLGFGTCTPARAGATINFPASLFQKLGTKISRSGDTYHFEIWREKSNLGRMSLRGPCADAAREAAKQRPSCSSDGSGAIGEMLPQDDEPRSPFRKLATRLAVLKIANDSQADSDAETADEEPPTPKRLSCAEVRQQAVRAPSVRAF
jgi:hypothetical protein